MKSSYFHFLILILILAIGVSSFFYSQGYPRLQIIVAIMISATYVLWGILHHALQKDLHPKVVIEYILMGVVAFVLLMTILI